MIAEYSVLDKNIFTQKLSLLDETWRNRFYKDNILGFQRYIETRVPKRREKILK